LKRGSRQDLEATADVVKRYEEVIAV